MTADTKEWTAHSERLDHPERAEDLVRPEGSQCPENLQRPEGSQPPNSPFAGFGPEVVAAQPVLPAGRPMRRTVNRVRLVRMGELTAAERHLWSQIQESVPALESPYFRPEFADLMDSVCDDVEIAVLQAGEEPLGFLPFHRRPGGAGLPLGRELSDFHGVIARPETDWYPKTLLAECGLHRWRFHHLIADQQPFRKYHYGTKPSPFADLSDGYAAYEAEQRQRQGSKRLKRIRRKERQMGREKGSVRFEFHAAKNSVFETLLRWKSQQYRDSGLFDLFSVDWIVRLLQRLLETQQEAFGGVLSVLSAGEEIAAVELSMRCGDVLHSWFPAYNRRLASYGPGNILFNRILQSAADNGIRRIHLGKAEENYKWSFASGAVEVAEGAVDLHPLRSTVQRGWYQTREWLKRTPLRQVLRKPARCIRRLCTSLSLG